MSNKFWKTDQVISYGDIVPRQTLLTCYQDQMSVQRFDFDVQRMSQQEVPMSYQTYWRCELFLMRPCPGGGMCGVCQLSDEVTDDVGQDQAGVGQVSFLVSQDQHLPSITSNQNNMLWCDTDMVFERYILTFESFKSTEIIKASFIDGN